jgi:hypothetical protein
MKKIKINDIRKNLENKFDIFICSSSFEERCFSIPKEVSKIAIPDSLIFYIDDLENKINQNAEKLETIFSGTAKQVAIKINDPVQTLKSMSQALNKVMSSDKPQNILIDITTFTHEGLLMLFKLLQLRVASGSKIKLFLCYSAAKEYSHNERNLKEKWLSKGVKSVRSILGYPGLFDPSKKNHLVVLFGFESERTRRLIDIFEYDLVSLAFGGKDVSITDDHQKLNEMRHEQLFSLYPNAKKFEISLIDANQTKSQLIGYLKPFSGYNTVIVPMNNKISTIGAGLSAIENPTIQLCYLLANVYNFEGYSLPGEDCYLLEIIF